MMAFNRKDHAMAKKFTITELLLHKIKKMTVPFISGHNRRMLNNTDFSIISNNCWGGVCYEFFGLPKLSPTVGTYLYADDYVKMISNLQYYMSCDLKIIRAEEANHYEDLKRAKHTDVPIGRLDDVEIVFLHYKDGTVAKSKWERRVRRINWDNIIIKFSYMSNCSDKNIKDFQKISGVKKFCFVAKPFNNMEDLILVPSRVGSKNDIGDDVFDWNKYIDPFELINRPTTSIQELDIN